MEAEGLSEGVSPARFSDLTFLNRQFAHSLLPYNCQPTLLFTYSLIEERTPMAKPNYSFEKRQRDLAKKQKKEEKRLRKQGTPDTPEDNTPAQPEDLAPQPIDGETT